jgi:hypothetical protein
MILGNPASGAAPSHDQSRITIDEIFRRHAARRPDALALIDAANRGTFTGGEPRRLTYAETDRMVSAIATRLRQMGLPIDAVVGIQLPNVVENILVTLGVLRAGMIAASLPLLCRRTDAVAALSRVGAKALITCGRVGSFNLGLYALAVAADVFSIRYVCGFGDHLPDGIVPFDDLFSAPITEHAPMTVRERAGNASAHLAAITFDVAEGGPIAVARSHAELMAGGIAVLLESRLAQDSHILSTIVPSSFAGLCLTLLPWLLCGGALALHHPFDASLLGRQGREERCSAIVLPGPVALRLAATGAFAVEGPACVIAAWRAPQELAAAPRLHGTDVPLVDVSIFGETLIAPARRAQDGKPRPLPIGPVMAPRDGAGGIVVAELALTEGGTLAARGAMVPHHSFPPGIEKSALPHFKIGPGGFVDSGYPCRVDGAAETFVVTGTPAGLVGVGGYRFPLRDLQEVVGRIDSTAILTALPDPLIGQRLIGNAADRGTMQAALNVVGINPIVVAAFRDRSNAEITER